MSSDSILQLLAGIALLAGGAEILVRGASRLALSLGISPLVVGLTVVGYGTSAPELAVSLNAALDGRAVRDAADGRDAHCRRDSKRPGGAAGTLDASAMTGDRAAQPS